MTFGASTTATGTATAGTTTTDEDLGLIDVFIEDLLEQVDTFLWVKGATIPHKLRCDDMVDDMVGVLSTSEKDELYDALYNSYEKWFGEV